MPYLLADDTVVGEPAPYTLHFEATVQDRDLKPEDTLARARDFVRCLEFHRARVAVERELTHAKMIALDAKLGELDPIIKGMREILALEQTHAKEA